MTGESNTPEGPGMTENDLVLSNIHEIQRFSVWFRNNLTSPSALRKMALRNPRPRMKLEIPGRSSQIGGIFALSPTNRRGP